jgi:hypothetical protein
MAATVQVDVPEPEVPLLQTPILMVVNGKSPAQLQSTYMSNVKGLYLRQEGVMRFRIKARVRS